MTVRDAVNKSMGPDRIYPSVLKEQTDVIEKPLSIFEQSWESGEVPADLKLVNIVPVFKKGKKRTPETTGLLLSFQCLSVQ